MVITLSTLCCGLALMIDDSFSWIFFICRIDLWGIKNWSRWGKRKQSEFNSRFDKSYVEIAILWGFVATGMVMLEVSECFWVESLWLGYGLRTDSSYVLNQRYWTLLTYSKIIHTTGTQLKSPGWILSYKMEAVPSNSVKTPFSLCFQNKSFAVN
jgi:hypothetical protein